MTAPSITPRHFYQTLEQDKRLTPALKVTLEGIYRLSKKHGYSFATDAYLSEKLNLSIRYLQKIFLKLEEFGYMTRQTFSERWEKGWRKKRKIYIGIPDSKNVCEHAQECSSINITEHQTSSYEGKENFWKKRTIQRGKTATRRRVAIATFQDILNLNLSQAEVKLTTLISQTPQLNFLTPHSYYQMLKRYGWEFLKQVCCEFMNDIQRNWRFIKSPEAIFFSKIKNWRQTDGD